VRPFRETQTCRNLLSTRYGVANISDDVLAYVQCALYDSNLPHFPAKAGPGVVYRNACAWREIRVAGRTNGPAQRGLSMRVGREISGFRREHGLRRQFWLPDRRITLAMRWRNG
jgi:hypothetical protein